MDFVTIKESHLESDLLVLKSILESEGILCYLKNEFSTQIMSHMPTFTDTQLLQIDNQKKRRTSGSPFFII